jgi:murein DD-endopeptidase MepM/ murein hydrolase activator NlpD
VPAASPRAQTRPVIRIVVGLFAFLLLASIAGDSDALALTPLGSQISSGRRSQAYFESAMLSQDRAIAAIKRQTRQIRRSLKQARKAVKRTRGVYRARAQVVRIRQARLSEVEKVHADTPADEIPEAYLDRLRSVRREVGKAIRQRRAAARQYRSAKRVDRARHYRLRVLKRQRRGAVSRREAAEGGLGAYIVRMTGLAQQRAELISRSQLAVGSSAFSWPAVGRLSQTYGCTGYALNPPRGSCRHFHDGLDIVAGYGSPVRTAADGVIAFAGWNPWDEGGRAWIMVVSHPDGYVTRYGHLLPGGRARVGRFVREGQSIGRMGNTGKSTGTHLHFELLRGSTPLSPWAYLPDGMVEARVTRAPNRKAGKATHRGGKAAKTRRGKRAEERRRERARARRKEARSSGADVADAAARQPLAESTTALVEISLDDATTMVCEVLEGSDRSDLGAPIDYPFGGQRSRRPGSGAADTGDDDDDPCAVLDDAPGAEGGTSPASGDDPPAALITIRAPGPGGVPAQGTSRLTS